MEIIAIALAIIGIVTVSLVVKRVKGRQVRKELKEAKLNSLKFDNFGHPFSIKELVEKQLKKISKPAGTLFEWSTPKIKGERVILIKLRSVIDSDKGFESKVSLEKAYFSIAIGGDFTRSYIEQYAKGFDWINNSYFNYSRDYRTPIKDEISDRVTKAAKNQVEKYILKYPLETNNEEKFGTI